MIGARRRRAAWRLLVVVVAGFAVQVCAWVVLARQHLVVGGAVVGGVGALMFVAVAVLTPLPTAGFWWPWQQVARRRRAANATTTLDAGAGFDLLFVVSILAVALPGQAANAWVQRADLDLVPDLAFSVGLDVFGLVLLFGILELRRRRHPDRPGPLPRTVELRARGREDQG